MPTANAFARPSGHWWYDPVFTYKKYKIPKLMLRAFAKHIVCPAIFYGIWCGFRVLYRDKVYTEFTGKTFIYGNISLLTHEPCTVEQIDAMKAARK